VSPVSLVRLAWYFVARLVARALLPHRGLDRFRAQYETEGLFPLEEREKKVVTSLSKCIACGACDAHFGPYDRIARNVLRAPSDFVLADARSLHDWDALVPALVQLRRGDLERLEEVCPAQIPFRRIARIAKKRAEELEAMRESGRSPLRLRRGRGSKHDPG
jgi:hypothetical protein